MKATKRDTHSRTQRIGLAGRLLLPVLCGLCALPALAGDIIHVGGKSAIRTVAEAAALEAPLHEYEDADQIRRGHGGVLHHPGEPETNAEQLASEQSQH